MNFLSGEAVVGEGGVRDGDLQRRDVEGRHVVLAAALVLVVDDVLPDVVLGAGVLDLGLAPPVVHHEQQHQHKQGGCTKYENNNKISPSDENGSLWLRVCAVGSGPARGTHAAEVAALAEVEAGAAVLAQAGLRALVLVNALGGAQPPLAF